MSSQRSSTEERIYQERITSFWTTALFITLTLLFGFLFNWRLNTTRLDFLAGVFLFFFLLFLFYTINYQTLSIHLTREKLKLKFGVFTWAIDLDNIESCRLDDIPILMRYGGAGIHFMLIRRRYRASFNFLEYPRVVIALKQKAGLVQDISFSTRQPEKILQLVQAQIDR